LAYDLLQNRAHVNLILNRLDEDVLSSLTGPEDQKYKDLDSKAYFVWAAQHMISWTSRKPSVSLRGTSGSSLETNVPYPVYGRLN